MPQTKFQDFIYTIIMVIIMVYAMVCYNISMSIGGMNNQVFILDLQELPIMVAIAFIIEFFIVGKLSQKIAKKTINFKKNK